MNSERELRNKLFEADPDSFRHLMPLPGSQYEHGQIQYSDIEYAIRDACKARDWLWSIESGLAGVIGHGKYNDSYVDIEGLPPALALGMAYMNFLGFEWWN